MKEEKEKIKDIFEKFEILKHDGSGTFDIELTQLDWEQLKSSIQKEFDKLKKEDEKLIRSFNENQIIHIKEIKLREDKLKELKKVLRMISE